MAGYSYGGLEVNVTAQTHEAANAVRSDLSAAGSDAAKSITQNLASGLSAIGGLLGATGKAAATGLGLATTAAIGFGVASFKTAARAGEMDATLAALAKTNNLSTASLQKSVTAVRDRGIETGVAQNLVAQFVRSELDLAKATDLARVAQDAAVISGQNSTETLDQLIHGITTQNTQVLRNAGITVNATKAQDEYAKSIGKSRKDLTEAEKAQATLNAVLTEGTKVAGAYDAAMREPGKVLRSFPRLVDDIKLSIGKGLVNAFKDSILAAYDLTKAFSKAIEPGGKLAPIFDAIGVAVAKLAAPLAAMITRWADLLNNLKPEQISRIVDVIKQFGPAIMLAAGALALFTGAGVLGQIPILGGLLSTLLGPIKMLVPTLLAVGKAAVGVIGGLTGIGGGAAGASSGLSALLGPVGLVIAAIAALVLTSAKFRTAVVDLGKAVISALRPAFDAIVAGVRQALPPILDLVRTIGDGLAPIIQKLLPLLAPLGQLLGAVLAAGFKQLAASAAALAPIVRVVLQVIDALLGVLVPIVAPVLRVAAGFLSAAAAASATVNPLAALVGIFTTVANAIATVVRWIFGGSPGLIPAFVALAGVVGSISGVLSGLVGIFSAMASGIAAAWSAVTGSTRAAMSAVTSAVSAGANAAKSAATSAFNGIRSAASSAMSATASAVSSAFASIRSAAASGASAALAAVSSAFGQIRGVVQSAMSAVPGIVSSALASAVGAARSGGAAIMNGLQAGIQSAAGAVMSTISSVASKISGALSSALKIGSPSRLTIPMGAALVEGLGVGWDNEIDHTLAGMAADLHAPQIGGGFDFGVGGLAGLGGAAAGATINVYPSAGMDERALAVMVSRELAWATAGGG
jgi:phage-related protein